MNNTLKGLVHPKMKTFIHRWNTNEDLLIQIWDLSVHSWTATLLWCFKKLKRS